MSDERNKKGRDFYATLGVERSANQGQIKSAYRKKAMKCHPDKNPGNEESAEQFRQLSSAYSVLSDPNKKRNYDLHGEEGNVEELSSVSVAELGTLGRLLGALVSKAGIPVPTEITQKVLTSAQHLAAGATHVPGFELPQFTHLVYGQTVSSTVDRQCAHFYKITISDDDLARGVIIQCTSNVKDKFKCVVFDHEGHVCLVEESQKSRDKRIAYKSAANMFLVPFARYNLLEGITPAMMRMAQEDDVPPVFMILDTFDKDVKHLREGTHLFCVYGDNWFQSVKYNLRCMVAVPPSAGPVQAIEEAEWKLAEKKDKLERIQPEFCELKKKFEEACKNLEADIKETAELIQVRESAYTDYITHSAAQYNNVPQAQAQQKGFMGGFGKLFG